MIRKRPPLKQGGVRAVCEGDSLSRHLNGEYLLRAAERARRPDREHMQSLRRHVPYWFVVVLLFGFAAFQIIMNPFGFSDLTQRYTQDIANLLIDGPYLYPETGRDQLLMRGTHIRAA